jgi:hypothetical protein
MRSGGMVRFSFQKRRKKTQKFRGKTAKSYESKLYLVNFNIVTVTSLPREHRKR